MPFLFATVWFYIFHIPELAQLLKELIHMRKWLIGILALVALALAGGYVYTRYAIKRSIKKDEESSGITIAPVDSLGGKKTSQLDLRPLFIEKLQSLLKKSSNGLYDLSIKDLRIDLLESVVTLQQVKMLPDPELLKQQRASGRLPNDVFSVTLDSLVIKGINLDDALTSKTMDYDEVRIVRPVIEVEHIRSKREKPSGDSSFSQRFLKEMERLSLKKLSISNGTVVLHKKGASARPTRLNQVQVAMRDIRIDSVTREDRDRFLFARNADLSFRDYNTLSRDGLYRTHIGSIQVKAPQQLVVLKDVSMRSPYSKQQFVSRLKFAKERYDLQFPEIQLQQIDWWAALNEEEIVADELLVKGGRLGIYLDRSLPPHSRMGNFPNQLLYKMPMKMDLKKIVIGGLDFSYSEYNPLSKQTGTIPIGAISLTIFNFSNVKPGQGSPLTIKGTASLLNQVPVEAQFSFDRVRPKAGGFTASIHSKGFEASLVNSFTMPMGLMRMDKGTLQSLTATVKGNEQQASGEVEARYQDLKLALLEKDKGEKELDKKGFTSFVANAFILKKDNPAKGKAVRKETAQFTRIPEGGFFMLVWKTIFTGVLKTIGAPTKIAKKTTTPPARN